MDKFSSVGKTIRIDLVRDDHMDVDLRYVFIH